MIPVPWRPVSLAPKLKLGYYYTNGLVFPTPPIARGVHITIEALKAAGHEVVPFTCFQSDTLLGLMYAFWTSDGHADLKRILAESGETADMYIEDPFLRFGNGKFLDEEWANDPVAKKVGEWEEKAGGGKGTTVAKVWELIRGF